MAQSRVWERGLDCVLNESIDLNLGPLRSQPGNISLSVVNVLRLYEKTLSEQCSFSLSELASAGSISNGLFVVNATVDASRCSSLEVSLFDSVFGSVKNVTVVGNVSILNLNLSAYNIASPVKLSRMLGYVATNRTVSSTASFFNLSSSL